MPVLVSPRKLRDAIEAGYDDYAWARELWKKNRREYVGRHDPRGDGRRRGLNLFRRAHDTIVSHIAFRHPEHEVETDFAALAPDAALQSLFLDRLSIELDRRKVVRQVLQDAFFAPRGILKTGIRSAWNLVKVNGRWYDRGRPFIKRISPDDWCCDPSARCREELAWEAEYYAVPRELLRDSGLANPDVVERMTGIRDGGAMRGSTSRHLAADEGHSRTVSDRHELLDMVELIDVALYDENGETLIVTMAADEVPDDDFLRIERHEGPGRGPYVWEEFAPLNDQLHGTIPCSAWLDQADAFYTITDKWLEDIEHTKRVLVADDSVSDDEIDTILEAPNGQVIRVKNVDGLLMVEFGGSSDIYSQAASVVYNWFNVQTGNMDILSGTGTDTDKATIFAGLQQNAMGLLEDYHEGHDAFENEVSDRLAWHGMSDPLMLVPMTHRMPGGELIQLQFDPSQRRGDHYHYRYRIVTRSTGRVDPNQRFARLLQLLDLVLRGAEVSVNTGGLIDVGGLARIGGQMLDIRQIQQIVRDYALQQGLALQGARTPERVPGQIGGPAPGLNPQAVSYGFRLTGEGGEGGPGPSTQSQGPASALSRGGVRTGSSRGAAAGVA